MGAQLAQGRRARRSHWVRPELVAEVGFTEWTNDGTLRHPSFQRLREDKNPKDVVREGAALTNHAACTA
jgi:bifunctional non-homologous end joining protein LigD